MERKHLIDVLSLKYFTSFRVNSTCLRVYKSDSVRPKMFTFGLIPGKRKGTHFSTQDLEMLGAQFCDTLLDYCDPDRTKVGPEPDTTVCSPADICLSTV